MFFLNKITQREKIVAYIKEHGSITAREADRKLGVMRLASRIGELRRDYIIRTEMIRVKNGDGSHSSVARYTFAEEVDNEDRVV